MKRTAGWSFVLAMAAVAVAMAADEIKLTAALKIDNGDFTYQRSVGTLAVDQTGKNMSAGIQEVTSSTNTLRITSDVTTGGYAWFRNLGTNDMIVAVSMRLKASDVAVLRVASTNIPVYCVTSGRTSRVEYWVNEE